MAPTLSPALWPTLKKGLGLATLYTAFGVGLKSIGSVFRLNDVKEAPPAYYSATARQEGTMLFLTGLVTLAAQVLLPFAFKHFNVVSELGRNVLRSVMIAPGYAASELLSRKVGDVSWKAMRHTMAKTTDDDETERTLLKRLSDFLYQTPHAGNKAQTFGQHVYNPANQVASLNVMSPSPSPDGLPRTTFPVGASPLTMIRGSQPARPLVFVGHHSLSV